MRPKLLAAAVSLALAAAALFGAGARAGTGLSPAGQDSPNAERASDIYELILAVSAGILLLVTVPLVLFILRYRNRGRSRAIEGPQIRGNTRLELAWTALPVVLLAVIVTFVFYKLPGINDLDPAEGSGGALEVQVEGRQFYWQYTYPNGVIAIDTLRAPRGRVVEVEITAPASDVNHSFWIPRLGGKFDAIPGQVTRTSFEADKLGTYKGACAEFCGIQHAAMLAAVEVMPRDEFDRWLAAEARAQQAGNSALGEQTYLGACAKCHGWQGQGLIGPPLRGNGLLRDREGLATIVRNGQGAMPAIGEGWRDLQMDALFRYVNRNLANAEGGADGGQG